MEKMYVCHDIGRGRQKKMPIGEIIELDACNGCSHMKTIS